MEAVVIAGSDKRYLLGIYGALQIKCGVSPMVLLAQMFRLKSMNKIGIKEGRYTDA